MDTGDSENLLVVADDSIELEEVLNISDDEGVEDDGEGSEEETEVVEDGFESGLKRKIKEKASIWGTGAVKVKENNVFMAKCLVCNKLYSCAKSNTSVIRQHLVKAHVGSPQYKKFIELDKKRKEEALERKRKKPKISILNYFTHKKCIPKIESGKLTSAVEDYIIQTNQSLNMVENPAFRKMMFAFNSGYVAPSRKTITSNIEKKVVEKKLALKKEIAEDIKETKTGNVTTDGGPSQNKNKTKKNTVTFSRITSDWKMKTDTLALVVAEGSQTGVVIRTVVKDVLDQFGYEDWDINMTTDDASAPRSARAPNRHQEVGLRVKYDTMCLDHQIHLLVRNALSLYTVGCTLH